MNRRLRPYLCAFALALLALTIQLPMLHSTAFAQTVDKESFEFEVTDNVTQVSPPVTVEVADSGADELISAQSQVHVVLNVALGKETSGKVAFSATAHSPEGAFITGIRGSYKLVDLDTGTSVGGSFSERDTPKRYFVAYRETILDAHVGHRYRITYSFTVDVISDLVPFSNSATITLR